MSINYIVLTILYMYLRHANEVKRPYEHVGTCLPPEIKVKYVFINFQSAERVVSDKIDWFERFIKEGIANIT